MGPKHVHLADCVSKPELLRGQSFPCVVPILNLRCFPLATPVFFAVVEHLQIVKALVWQAMHFCGCWAERAPQLQKQPPGRG